METFWEREYAAAVLAGHEVCPYHRLPCWVCMAVADVLGVPRYVTWGIFPAAIVAFQHFESMSDAYAPSIQCIHARPHRSHYVD